MLNATIKACPVFGGTLKSYDDSDVKNMRGVKKVVRVGDNAVAVIADTWWRAKKALDALPITWDEGPNAKINSQTISDMLDEGLAAEADYVGNKQGDAMASIANAAKTIEATYSYPHQNHATMEPMNTTALWTADKCEIWCPTQNGEAAHRGMAKAAGLPLREMRRIQTAPWWRVWPVRGMTDFVEQAVEIAKQVPGVPVKLLWTREEDMMHGNYHPTTKARMVAGFG